MASAAHRSSGGTAWLLRELTVRTCDALPEVLLAELPPEAGMRDVYQHTTPMIITTTMFITPTEAEAPKSRPPIQTTFYLTHVSHMPYLSRD